MRSQPGDFGWQQHLYGDTSHRLPFHRLERRVHRDQFNLRPEQRHQRANRHRNFYGQQQLRDYYDGQSVGERQRPMRSQPGDFGGQQHLYGDTIHRLPFHRLERRVHRDRFDLRPE